MISFILFQLFQQPLYNQQRQSIDIRMQEQKMPKNALIAQHYKMRFYENEFPTKGELILGQSEKSEENGCYVALLEYNNKTGMMPVNEYTTTMRKSLHRAMKVGKKEILRVIRVDSEKGINTSTKAISICPRSRSPSKTKQRERKSTPTPPSCIPSSSTQQKAARWRSSSSTRSTSGPCTRTKKFSSLITLSITSRVCSHEDRFEEIGVKDELIRKCLLDELKRRFKKPIIKTMANFSVSCRSFEGIHAIKKALLEGIEASKEKGFDVNIFIIGAPKYTCEISTSTIEAGKEGLTLALSKVQSAIKKARGDFSIDRQPYIVGDTNQHIKEMIKQQEVAEVVDSDDSGMGEADD